MFENGEYMTDVNLFLLSAAVFGIASYKTKSTEWRFLFAGLGLLMLGVWVG
jgi:hypothetical protein